MKTLTLFLLLLITTSIRSEDVFIKCNADQIDIIKEAKFNALHLLSNSINLENDYLMDKWFFGNNPQEVKNNFLKIRNAMVTVTNVYDCNCSEINIYAKVSSLQPYIVRLCNSFWITNKLGIDSQAGTLIHEYAHFTQTIGAWDLAGDYETSKQLIFSSHLSIMNANSYEYYAEETLVKPIK